MSRLGRWVPVVAIVALVGAAMLAASYSDLTFRPRPYVAVTVPPPSPPPNQSGVRPTEGPRVASREPAFTVPLWLLNVLGVLCLALVAVIVAILFWIAVRERLRERVAVPESTDPAELHRRRQERVRAAVDEGVAELELADGDPRAAVIVCWARLEGAAAAVGTPREPGDTSTDLVERLLAEHAVSRDVLAGFAAVYRQARFGPHVVDEAMREQALAALRQVRDELMRDAGRVPALREASAGSAG